MTGVVVFSSLREALNAGYHIYGKSERGYLARLRTDAGWALALIDCRESNAGTIAYMERDEKKPPAEHDEKKQESDEARRGDRTLDDYDKTVADSFPASDPPAQP